LEDDSVLSEDTGETGAAEITHRIFSAASSPPVAVSEETGISMPAASISWSAKMYD